jgi:hypothetical protein
MNGNDGRDLVREVFVGKTRQICPKLREWYVKNGAGFPMELKTYHEGGRVRLFRNWTEVTEPHRVQTGPQQTDYRNDHPNSIPIKKWISAKVLNLAEYTQFQNVFRMPFDHTEKECMRKMIVRAINLNSYINEQLSAAS